MTFYHTTGYFDPGAFTSVQEAVLSAAVDEPARILGRFADLVSTAGAVGALRR